MKYQLLQLRLGKSKHIHVYQDETGKNWMTPSQLRTALNMYRYAIDKEELESKQVRPKPNKSVRMYYDKSFNDFCQDRQREYVLKRQLRQLQKEKGRKKQKNDYSFYCFK